MQPWQISNPPCRIESSNLDGSDRSVLIDAFLGMPNGLTIDFDQGLLCWTDGGAAMTKIRQGISFAREISHWPYLVINKGCKKEQVRKCLGFVQLIFYPCWPKNQL